MLDNDHEALDRDRLQRVLTPDAPSAGAPATPPPPMPTARPAAPAKDEAPQAKPEPAGGWEVDPDQLSWFTNLVLDARDRLRDVQVRVDRMRSEAYTPRLGTSPVGTQLERKFTDRLDAPPDNPEHPTTGGLRPMLAEAMRRMDEFVAGAEAAATRYREFDESAARTMSTSGQDPAGQTG